MELNLKCLEWTNMNKNARLIKSKNKKNKSNDHGNSVYLLQIVGYKNNNLKLGCLSSDQIINVYDQENLKLITQINNLDSKGSNINEIGFFKQTDNMIFSCSDDGKLKCWDLRNFSSDTEKSASESLCFSCSTDDKREFLSADVNSNDSLFCVGTNKNIDDSLVYIYDIRFNNKYLHKFSESHSNDVTQVKFDTFKASKFCSGSLDGLICLYNLEQEPEVIPKSETKNDNESGSEDEDDDDGDDEDPDLMEQVFNSDSSIHKIGYISSNQTESDRLYAITYTNDLFVWDLNTHDIVYKHQSKNKNIINGKAINVMDDHEEDYFFDCFYYKPNVMVVCKGDKNGNFKIYNGDTVLYESNSDDHKEKNNTTRSHRDIIRSSYWNNEYFFTAGEDGFLFKWKISEKDELNESTEIKDEKQLSKRERIQESDDENNTNQANSNKNTDTDIKRFKKGFKKNNNKNNKKNFKSFKFSKNNHK